MLKKITLLLITFLMLALGVKAADNRFTLVIDAGHGGHDAGALGATSKEKNINLAVALKFGEYVEKNMPDVKVVYTRKSDVFVPLMERANIANKANADLFISVHTNALPAGKIARGFETYTLGMHRAKDNLDVAIRENSVISMEDDYRQTYEGFDPNSSESYIIFEFIQGKNMERSVDLARMIQKSVCGSANRPDKGVHQAGFLVLRETSMPSCLIELGFITTPDEERTLNSAKCVNDMAKAIYQGLVKYRNRYDSRLTVPYRTSTANLADEPAVVPVTYKKSKDVALKDSTVVKKSADSLKTMRPKQKEPQKRQEPAKKEAAKKEQEPSRGKGSESGKPEGKKTVEAKSAKTTAKTEAQGKPVFKLQILVSNRVLKAGDAHFKGEKDFDHYQENGMYKYTVGASTDYNEIYRLRKTLAEKFPEAFIIAFKDGSKYDVQEAIKEFKQNKNR